MPSTSSRAARLAATAIALTAAAGAVSSSHFARAQSSPPAVQWRVQDGGNGHWYQVVEQPVQWVAARNLAIARGGDLCSIESASELYMLKDQFCGSGSSLCGSVHIGGMQEPTATVSTQGWRWLTGGPVSLPVSLSMNDSPCNQGQAGENHEQDFLHFVANWTALGDVNSGAFSSSCGPESSAFYFLVEWSADCNNDGVIDYGQCRDGLLADYNGNNTPDCCESGLQCVTGSYPVQWRAEDGGNGHWYGQAIVPISDATFMELRAAAEALGGHLPTVTSEGENEFVFRSIGGALGLYREPGQPWRNVTGEPVTYLNWADGQPDNGTSQLVFAAYCCHPSDTWGDFSDAELGNPADPVTDFRVEWSADCNGDGIVDKGQILRGQLPDSNGDGVPNICQCPGDVIRDTQINGVDLAAILGAWGTSGQGQFRTDIDNDGIVSGTDLAFVLGGWGPCPP